MIKEFLSSCRIKTYASGMDGEKLEGNGEKYVIKEGDLTYQDVYYDQHWLFQGQEVVFEKEMPVWSMCYRGGAVEGVDTKEVFGYLMSVLKAHSDEVRLPGSKNYSEGEWRYEDKAEGNFDEFSGEETIYKNDKLVHWVKYFGGKIN